MQLVSGLMHPFSPSRTSAFGWRDSYQYSNTLLTVSLATIANMNAAWAFLQTLIICAPWQLKWLPLLNFLLFKASHLLIDTFVTIAASYWDFSFFISPSLATRCRCSETAAALLKCSWEKRSQIGGHPSFELLSSKSSDLFSIYVHLFHFTLPIFCRP